MAHSSLRFGIGRFTTEAEVDYVIEKIVAVVQRLRDMRYAVPPLIALLYPLTATTVARCGRWSRRALTLTLSTGPSIKFDWVICRHSRSLGSWGCRRVWAVDV